MDVEKRDEMFGILCKMSDRQVDPAVKARLQGFIGRPNEEVKDELLGLIDDTVYCSWTSNFEIQVMESIWFEIGGSPEELKERNAQLNKVSTDLDEQDITEEVYKTRMEEFKQRFKWQACSCS